MSKGTVSLAIAKRLADRFIDEFSPYCERIEVAGSIRREKSVVGDIEILYVPRWEASGQESLFGDRFEIDPLDEYVREQMVAGVFDKRFNSTGHPIGYGLKNKALVHVPSGIGLDLFSTEARNYGMSLVIRTGPAEFNVWMMARFRSLGMEGHAYAGITKGDEVIDCPDEETVFHHLGWPWVEPKERM